MTIRLAIAAVPKLLRLLRTRGWRFTLHRVAQRLYGVGDLGDGDILVSPSDMISVDWAKTPHWRAQPRRIGTGPLKVAWISSPPSPASGGHQNMLRFLDYLERAGHECTIYLFDWRGQHLNIEGIARMVRNSSAYPNVRARFELYDRERGVADDIDAIVATAWETAYPAYLDPSHARRLYLVQDFEPMFYPTGTNSVLAENTYRFGFTGLTAGGWLRKKLNTEYGMETRHFDFAVDPDIYRLLDGVTRDGVFFYARRETPRRGFDLGMAALHEFHRIMPEVPIHLAGAHVDDFEVPFPFTMHSGLSLTELNALYSRCKAGLVISLTNMSLLPLELVAAGTQVVMNDGPNNREVSTNEFIHYVPAVPHELARALVRLMGASESAATRREISDSSRQRTWDDSGRQFVSAFEGVMRD